MPNWRSNALSIHSDNDKEMLVVDSVFGGKLANRTDGMTSNTALVLPPKKTTNKGAR